MASKRVCYVVFSDGPAGLLTRAQAIATAFTARHTKGINFQVFGTVLRGSVPDWLPAVKNSPYLFTTNEDLIAALTEYKPDLLIVDSYPGNLVNYLRSKDRPASVWGIMRHTPGALGTAGTLHPALYGALDRLYQIEPSNHGIKWSDALTKERTQSIAEKEAGVRDKNYVEPNPGPDASNLHKWPEWYARHARDSRKLIAPIVNVDATRILTRLEARKALLEHAELDPKEATSDKPIVLVAVSGNFADGGFDRFRQWQAEKLKEWGVTRIPQEDRLLIQTGFLAFPKLPELWRYLAGADYLLTSCGYNTFYETRYLKALGSFTGKAAFWAMANYPDQAWRAAKQDTLFSGQFYPHGLNPIENGSSYIAECIIRKLVK